MPGASPSNAIAALVFWLVFVFFVFAAIGALGIPAVTVFMNQVLAYLPDVIVASLIFVIAALVAGAVAGGVTKFMGDTPTGKIVATVLPALVIVTALALGLALAFGLGAVVWPNGSWRTPTARARSRSSRPSRRCRPAERAREQDVRRAGPDGGYVGHRRHHADLPDRSAAL